MSGRLYLGTELRRGKEIGLLIPESAIDLPADQIFAAGRGHVIAGLASRRPICGSAARRRTRAVPRHHFQRVTTGSSRRHRRPARISPSAEKSTFYPRAPARAQGMVPPLLALRIEGADQNIWSSP